MRLRSTATKWRGLADCLNSRREPEPLTQEPDGESPFLVEFFMVQGAGFKCMAYRSGDGKWRTAFEGIELPGNIRVLE